MTARGHVSIACLVLASTIVAASAIVDRAETAPVKAPRGVIEDCSTIRGVTAAREFTRPRNLVVGPLAILRARGVFRNDLLPHAGTVGEVGDKLFVLVQGDHRVTLELTRSTRRGAGLAFGPYPDGEVRLRDTRRVVTFVACRRGESRATSPPTGWPVSGWVGFLIVRSPRCVPIRIWVDNEPQPRRAVIRFAVRECA